jgi:CubicO group peptidase (beta-lactamase class C family)
MVSTKRRGVMAGALAFCAVGRGTVHAALVGGAAPQSDERILELLRARLAARQSLGIVVGVREGRRQRLLSAGRMGKDDPRPIDGDTVFGIASVTKAFVGLLLADAVGRGELTYEAEAARYLPQGVRLPQRGRAITVLDLVTHTSGLPHELPEAVAAPVREGGRDAARAVLYEHLASYELRTEPGTAWSYSNLGYALLGHILERRSGLDYETLLRRRITGPLGMESTAPSSVALLRERRAHPHLASLEPSPEWRKPWMEPVLQSTARDLLTFVAACLGQVDTPLAPAVAAMLKVRRPAPALQAEQALGFYVYRLPNGPMIGHTGAGGGFTATVMFEPEAGNGVVLLSNAEVIQEDLARHVLHESLPLEAAHVALALAPALLDGYVGEYRDDTGGVASIRRREGGLVLLMPAGHKAPLTPESPTSFFVVGYSALTVTFELDADRKARSLVWTLAGKATAARRVDASPPTEK